MRRRMLLARDAAPQRLRRFNAADWPGDLHDALQMWEAERRAYVTAHPYGALGTAIDVLRQHLTTRRRLWLELFGEPHYTERRPWRHH